MSLPVYQTTLVNENGDARPRATLEIRTSDGDNVKVYSDAAGLSVLSEAGDVEANVQGTARCYLPPGTYRLTAKDGINARTYPDVHIAPLREMKDESGTTYTLAVADAGNSVRFTSDSAVSASIPTNSTVQLPIDTEITLIQGGEGVVTVTGATGVAATGDLKTTGEGSTIRLRKTGTNNWLGLVADPPLPVSADTYLRRNAENNEFEAVTPQQVADELAQLLSLPARYQVFPVVQRAVDASLYTKQTPQSIYDAGSDRTFIVYAGPGRDVYMIFYDHGDQFWGQPVMVAVNPIRDSKGVEDDHGAPAVAMDGGGYIHVLYGSHNTKCYWAKSSSPRDISNWTTVELSGVSDMTYAGVAVDDATGDLYSFFRAGVTHGSTYPAHEFGGLMRLPMGDGSWQEVAGGIIDMSGYPGAQQDVYPTDVRVVDGKVYLGWVVTDGAVHNDVRKDVYVAYYSIADGDMYGADGVSLGSQVTFANRASALVHEVDYTEGPKLEFSDDGTIYATFCKAISDPEGSGHFVAVWDGTSWTVNDTGARTNYFFFAGQTRIGNDGSLELFVPVDGEPVPTPFVSSATGTAGMDRKYGAGVAVYKASAAADDWQFDQMVARKDQIACQGARVVSVPRNSHPGLKCIFSAASTDRSHFLVPIYAVTDENYEPLRVVNMLTSIPQERTIYCNDDEWFFDYTGVSVGVWQEVDVSGIVNSNAHSVVVEVLLTANGGDPFPVEWVIRARRAGTNRPSDVVVRAAADTNAAQGAVVEIPLSFDRKFEVVVQQEGVKRVRCKLLAYKTI